MLQKAENALCRAFLKARLAMMKLEQEENGNTVETIILIAVAVIVAGALLNFLTSNGFTNPKTQQPCGLVEFMFAKIATAFEDLFPSTETSSTKT